MAGMLDNLSAEGKMGGLPPDQIVAPVFQEISGVLIWAFKLVLRMCSSMLVFSVYVSSFDFFVRW